MPVDGRFEPGRFGTRPLTGGDQAFHREHHASRLNGRRAHERTGEAGGLLGSTRLTACSRFECDCVELPGHGRAPWRLRPESGTSTSGRAENPSLDAGAFPGSGGTQHPFAPFEAPDRAGRALFRNREAVWRIRRKALRQGREDRSPISGGGRGVRRIIRPATCGV